MGTSPYNALTSRGIVLVSVSPSQNALDDPSFELFGEPENPESITRLLPRFEVPKDRYFGSHLHLSQK